MNRRLAQLTPHNPEFTLTLSHEFIGVLFHLIAEPLWVESKSHEFTLDIFQARSLGIKAQSELLVVSYSKSLFSYSYSNVVMNRITNSNMFIRMIL